jgi:hypothetical protein
MTIQRDDLSPENAERIKHLNACLLEAADWIEERAELTRAAYSAGGGAVQQQPGGHWEDFEFDAIVKCSLGREAPDFTPDDEHADMIAAVTDSLKHAPEREKGALTWKHCGDGRTAGEGSRISPWAEGLPHIKAFRKTPFCFLFHEIFAHALHHDLDALLKIGEIEINLVLTRQRGVAVEAEPLAGKWRRSSPRSVFSRTPCFPADMPLTRRDVRYARLLNQKMREAQVWIEEQARRGEKEYLESGGRDRRLTADNAYEDYEMMMEVCGCLGERHPEYDEDNDNIVVKYSAPIPKENQRVFGRARNVVRYSRYRHGFPPGAWGDAYATIQPCGLFWDIFDRLDHDWLKMLGIGQLWLDVSLVQRRITQV